MRLCLAPLTKSQTHDLVEIIEDRYKLSSTILATQVPVEDWHERMANPTLADAILDRVVHNAYRLELKGESMRKKRPILTQGRHKEI